MLGFIGINRTRYSTEDLEDILHAIWSQVGPERGEENGILVNLSYLSFKGFPPESSCFLYSMEEEFEEVGEDQKTVRRMSTLKIIAPSGMRRRYYISRDPLQILSDLEGGELMFMPIEDTVEIVGLILLLSGLPKRYMEHLRGWLLASGKRVRIMPELQSSKRSFGGDLLALYALGGSVQRTPYKSRRWKCE